MQHMAGLFKDFDFLLEGQCETTGGFHFNYLFFPGRILTNVLSICRLIV